MIQKLTRKDLERLKKIPDFKPELYICLPRLHRSKKWRLHRMMLLYFHAIPYTREKEYDDYWFNFILRELRTARHTKKRMLSKLYKKADKQYIKAFDTCLKRGGTISRCTTLGTILSLLPDFNNTMYVAERVRMIKYQEQPDFKERVDQPTYTMFNREYWEDLQHITATVRQAFYNQRKDNINGREKI